MNLDKGKKTILGLFAVLSAVVVVIGGSYAFFSFTQEGTTENTVSASSIKFHYDETTHKGAGISLNDALPVDSNNAEKTSSNYFEFNITGKTANQPLSYVVTAKLDDNSDDIGEIVDLYLTDDTNTELFGGLHKYSNLIQYRNKNATEKVIYTGTIAANTASYDEDFRLRMWIDESVNLSGTETTVYKCDGTTVNQAAYDSCVGTKSTELVMEYPYENKIFKITINVYTDTNISGYTPLSNDATLSSLSMNGCTLNEAFDPNITHYTCNGSGPISNSAFNANPSAYISYTTTNSNATAEPGAGWIIDPNTNVRTYSIGVMVTAEDGTTTKTYSINYYQE